MTGFLRKTWDALKEWGNTIPNCPSCGGTGVPPYERSYAYEDVFWKGRIERVCWQCKGAGKV